MIVQLLISLLTRGRVTNFFQLLGKCMDAKPKQHNRGNIIFRRTLQDSKRSYVPVMNVGYSEALWRGNI